LRRLSRSANSSAYPFTLLKEVQRINIAQKQRFLKNNPRYALVLREKKLAVWGLTFNRIRMTFVPRGIDLVSDLLREGANVTAYDPKGMEKAREVKAIADARFARSALEAVDGAEAL